MKTLNNLGIHIFEKTNKLDWETEIVAMNLLSGLTWKYFHGPLVLYCNSEYKSLLEKWGVDTIYDNINTHILDNKTLDIDYKKYWAFSKLLAIEHLQDLSPFTVFDTDLWFLDSLEIDEDVDMMMYHLERFSENYPHNVYIDFDQMIPQSVKEMNFDKEVLPTNAAIMHFNNNEIIKEWVQLSKEIALFNKDLNFPHSSSQMCFVEQRLLPMLLQKRNLKYSTFIDNIYLTHLAVPQDGSEWYPRLDNNTKESSEKFGKIKHVWGLKKMFDNKEIKYVVMDFLIEVLNQFPMVDKPYSKLWNKIVEEHQQLIKELQTQPASS